MASLNPQTLINPTKSYYVKNPIDLSGLEFAGNPPVTILNQNGILTTNTGDILNDSLWSQFYASTGHIDMAPGGTQRITATDSQLYFNGQPLASGGTIADWSYFPADSGHVDFSGPTQRLTADDFNLIYNGVRILPGQGQDWFLFPAETDVDMSGNSLNNCNEVKTDKISDRTGNLLIQPDETLNIVSDQMNITVGDGNVVSPSKINITARNGTYGEIDIQADGSEANGAVYITANGGSIGSSSFGGNITLTANSGPIRPTNFTSAIKLNAACVESYAGAIPAIGSLTGYNYVFGNVGVNIQSDFTGPLLPNTPGTVYLFGRLGVTLQSAAGGFGLFCSDIKPYWDGGVSISDLVIQGRYAGNIITGYNIANVQVKQVSKIDGVLPYENPSDPSGISFAPGLDITGLVTINDVSYVPTQAWASQPASKNVDISGNSITRCLNINTDTINNLPPIPPLIVIPYGYQLSNSIINSRLLFNGTGAIFAFNIPGGVNAIKDGFYCTFINGNTANLDMEVYIGGTPVGVAKSNNSNTLVFLTSPSASWYMYS
jgi:hypothetical protein